MILLAFSNQWILSSAWTHCRVNGRQTEGAVCDFWQPLKEEGESLKVKCQVINPWDTSMQLTCADAQRIPAICVIRLLRRSFPCDVILHRPGDLQPVCLHTCLFLPLHTALLSPEDSVLTYVFLVLPAAWPTFLCIHPPMWVVFTAVSLMRSISSPPQFMCNFQSQCKTCHIIVP